MADPVKVCKRPETLEAMQWTGANSNEVVQWLQGGWHSGGAWIKQEFPSGAGVRWSLVVPSAGRDAEPGDWLVRSFRGVEVMKPEQFEGQYQTI
jgi:hypothetical protein